MLMEGSCHCGAVSFSAESHTFYPYMHCYCSICRKTSGCGGFGINLRAEYDSLKIQGEEKIGTYQAWMNPERTERSPGFRNFCRECGTALWVWDPRWPEMFHPHASCIDTALPKAPERFHVLIENAPDWVPLPEPSDTDTLYNFSGQSIEEIIDSMESLEQWHKNRGLWVD